MPQELPTFSAPQDFPLESSETLNFTPECFAELDKPPVFRLRPATRREKRFRERMHREEGVVTHSDDATREETIRGLHLLVTDPEQAAEWEAHLREYWKAIDDWPAQLAELKKDLAEGEDEPEFEYDKAMTANLDELTSRLERAHKPLAKIAADHAEYQEMAPLFHFAVIISGWSNFDVKCVKDRGYLTIDCVDKLVEELRVLEKKAGAPPGRSFSELYVAVINRTYLTEEEAKNSESSSQSTTSQEPSNEAAPSEKAGKSPTSASSKKTPPKG